MVRYRCRWCGLVWTFEKDTVATGAELTIHAVDIHKRGFRETFDRFYGEWGDFQKRQVEFHEQTHRRLAANVLGNFKESIDKESISMETKTVQVRFEDHNKVYNFFVEPELEDLKEGEKIVVRAATGLAIVTVLSEPKLSTIGRDKATAWVISRIDFSGEEKRTKRAELEKELKKAIEATSVIERAKQLASLNPELAKLIEALEELDK